MPRKITFNVPVRHKNGDVAIEQRTGHTMWHEIGDKPVKFVLQDNGNFMPILVHWGTGFVVSRALGQIALQIAVNNGFYQKNITARDAAKRALAGITPETFFATIADKPIINR